MNDLVLIEPGRFPREVERVRLVIERMNATSALMLETVRPAMEKANEAFAKVRTALLDAFPLCLPHRTEGWVRWCGDGQTARRCYRSFGHRGRARMVRAWAKHAACIPALQLPLDSMKEQR